MYTCVDETKLHTAVARPAIEAVNGVVRAQTHGPIVRPEAVSS